MSKLWNKLISLGKKEKEKDKKKNKDKDKETEEENCIHSCYKITNVEQDIPNHILAWSIWVTCLVELDSVTSTSTSDPKFICYDDKTMPIWLNYVDLPEKPIIYGTGKAHLENNTYLKKCELFLYTSKYYTADKTGPVYPPDNFVYYDHGRETVFLNKSIGDTIYIYEICKNGDTMYDNMPFTLINKQNCCFVTNLYLLKYSN